MPTYNQLKESRRVHEGIFGKGVQYPEYPKVIEDLPNDNKGELNGKCNITSCQKSNSATWFNHSTRKYYCESCAMRLNNDEFNKRDAMRVYGHDLCTEHLSNQSNK